MTGFNVSPSKLIVVKKEREGMSAESYKNNFEMAVQAIRDGIYEDEGVVTLKELLKENHLDSFIFVSDNLCLDILMEEDDIRNNLHKGIIETNDPTKCPHCRGEEIEHNLVNITEECSDCHAIYDRSGRWTKCQNENLNK